MKRLMRQQRSAINTNILLPCLIVLGLLMLVLLLKCGSQKAATAKAITRSSFQVAPTAIGLPQTTASDNLIQHTAYTLSFNTHYNLPVWIAYLQTGAHSRNANEVREPDFSKDPLATYPTATGYDYRSSGYDRGHMAPAEDMAWSKLSMQESFYYTNVCPQQPTFNRGVWSRLEALLRYWSEAYDSVYIVTGPVLTPGLPTMGTDKISVPAYYYKVVLEYKMNEVKGIGFVLPNQPSAASLQQFAVSIDSVEHLTGIDFFAALPDDVEERIESSLDVQQWSWRREKN